MFEKSLVFNTNFIEPINNIGVILYENKDYKLAIEYYKKVLSIKQNHSIALNNLRLAEQKLNKKSEQIKNDAFIDIKDRIDFHIY